MKHYFLISVFILISHNTWTQITIDECQEKAKANYPLIKEYELIAKSTEYTLDNANKAYLPQVSITGIAGYIFGGLPFPTAPGKESDKGQLIGIAQVNQIIWDGGAISVQKNIAKASAAVEKSTVDISIFSIQERVSQLFFGILLIDEQLKQLNNHNENLNLNLKKVKLAKDNGLSYQSDVDELNAEILSLEQKKIEFNFTRKGYMQMLSLLIGETLKEDTQLQKPLLSEAIESLTNKRPEMNLFSNQIKLIEAQSSINTANNLPKIGLLGAGVLIEPGISFGSSKFNSLGVVGLSMSWNSNGLFKSSTNKNLDKVRIERILNQQHTFLFNNKLELDRFATEIAKQREIMAKDDEIVRLKGSIKKAYQTKYTSGIGSMNDLLSAMNKENEALSNKALHYIQLLMSSYNYKNSSGN